MKRSLFLAVSISLLTIHSSADYLIKYNVEPEPHSIILKEFPNTPPTSVSPIYTSWISVGNPFNCTDWTPDSNSIQVGQIFTQERSCSINEERQKQNRIKLPNGSIQNDGSPIVESRVSQANQTQSATGTLETWVAYSASNSPWVNTSAIYGCNNWTPSADTVVVDVPFEQTANDCKLDQTRNSQAREQETTTLAIRNVGSPTVENQTLTGQVSTRNSVGTLVVEDCRYSASGTKSYWQEHRSASNLPYLTIYFENVTIANQSTSVGPKTVGGYYYTRGTLVTSSGTGIGYLARYYICRKKV